MIVITASRSAYQDDFPLFSPPPPASKALFVRSMNFCRLSFCSDNGCDGSGLGGGVGVGLELEDLGALVLDEEYVDR